MQTLAKYLSELSALDAATHLVSSNDWKDVSCKDFIRASNHLKITRHPRNVTPLVVYVKCAAHVDK